MLQAIEDSGVGLIGIDPSMTLTYQSEYTKYLSGKTPPSVMLIQDWLVENIDKLETPKTDPKLFKLLPHCTESTNATASIKNWKILFERFGHKLDVINVGCCGMSGTFGHEARNKETSKKLFKLSIN